MKTIVTKCGCQNLKQTDLVKTKVLGRFAQRCPHHSRQEIGSVEYVLFSCPGCNGQFKYSLKKVSHKKLCDDCQAERSREISRIKNAKKTKEEGARAKKRKGTNSLWYKEVA